MRKPTHKKTDLHSDWLAQVDVDGPFLAYPVLKDMWPSGVDRLGDTDGRLVTFKQAFVQWQRALDSYMEQPRTPKSKDAYDSVRRAWIDVVLDNVAEWEDVRTDADFTIRSPGEQITVTATSALQGRDGATAALLLVCEPTGGLRDAGLDGWAATNVDRMAMLLRKAQVEVGIVTDGQWWALVWAKDGKPTGSGMVNALTWAEEPLLRDAFLTLINQRRFRAPDAEQRLSRLFERSELEAEEITEALGTQVRRSVELLVQAFSEARLEAARAGDPDPLTEKPDDVYQAAVTVMMRIVFLLFAEERDMLPTEQLYWDSYAIKDLLQDLRAQAGAGEEQLDETFDAWYRLLAVSRALHGGVNYDEMRMPAYGGSLLDPDRFPWLHAVDQRGRLGLEVSDRVMLHVLESVQAVVVKGERRRISFREIDVEQIGYIYEGLLGYSCADVADDVIVGLVGKDGEEPEIASATLQRLYDEAHEAKSFAEALRDWVGANQPSATPWSASKLTKLYNAEVDEPEMRRLLTPVAAGDEELLGFLVDWSGYIRRDLRGIPLVIPPGGLVVVETPSRKNAGAHYTPRSLAEEVVLHALEPLVYEPGPLQTNDDNLWRLKSAAAILDLKVADIAAGSGAFLVAAARYLGERLVEAWTAEEMLNNTDPIDPDNVRRLALREVIARCLYGADINPMAVEMCKLSLWLVSMDKTKPFSFVDDKIFCGNSLLGLTTLDQLRYLHLYPTPTTMHQQLLVDIDAKIDTATQLRHELASPVEERDPMRSSRAKTRLLAQFRHATAELRLIGDGIVAAGLPWGGKAGLQLDDAFKALSWSLHEAFPIDGSPSNPTKLRERIASGLTPTVNTDYERWEPLHWVVEAPDVMIEHGGFDAVIGNPPFLGGKKITPALGKEVRDWFVAVEANGKDGNADLVAYFLLRASQLVNSLGTAGLIATDTVAQADTREVGLDQILTSATIFRAVRSRRWPATSANVNFAAVWFTKRTVLPVLRNLEGVMVAYITPLLEPAGRFQGNPLRLRENRGIAFVGSYVNGIGFTMTHQVATKMIDRDPKLDKVIRPFTTGADLTTSPTQSPGRHIVDFGNLSPSEIIEYDEAYAHLILNVKDYRKSLTNKPHLAERWWVYESRAQKLYAAIGNIERVIAIPRVSQTPLPVMVSSDCVFNEQCTVLATVSPSMFGILSSSVHQAWVQKYASTMGKGLRYGASDVFETFARPEGVEGLGDVGALLDNQRREIMMRRQIGMNDLYKLVNDPDVKTDLDVETMRNIHVEIDKATISAYGWHDVEPGHGFYTYRQVKRWTLSSAARVEILDRLLELNFERACAEGQHVPAQLSSAGPDTLFS